MSQLGDLGELSFKMFKLGEVSLGIGYFEVWNGEVG